MSRNNIERAKRLVGALSATACAAIMAATMLPATLNAAELSARDAAIERSQILDLLAQTLLAFDNRDYPQFAAHFADDGVFTVVEIPSNTVMRQIKRADMVAQYSRLPPPKGDPHHFTSNLTVDFRDDSHATLRGYYMVMSNNGANVAPRPVGMGQYASQVVKQDGKWKFQEYRALRAAGEDAPRKLE